MSLLNEVLKDLDSQQTTNSDQELLRQYAAPSPAAAGMGQLRVKRVAVAILVLGGVVLLGLGVRGWMGSRGAPEGSEMPVAKAPAAQPAQTTAGQQAAAAPDGAQVSAALPRVGRSSVPAPAKELGASGVTGSTEQASPEALSVDREKSVTAGSAGEAKPGALAKTDGGASAGATAVELDPARDAVTVKPVAMLPRFSGDTRPPPVKKVAPKPAPVEASKPVSRPKPAPVRSVRPAWTPPAAPTPPSAFSSEPRTLSYRNAARPVARPSLKPSVRRLYEMDLAERAEAMKAIEVGDFSGAESRLRRFIAAHPEAKLSRSTLATVLIEQNRPVEAEQVLIGGMAQDEEGMGRVKLLARTHIARNDFEAAKRILDANPISVDKDPEYHSLRAAVYQRTGDHSAAASTYRQLLNDYPPQPAWWLGLAVSLEATGRRKDAVYAYRQVRDFHTVQPALRAYASERIVAITR